MFKQLKKVAAALLGATMSDVLVGPTPTNLVVAQPDHRQPPEMTWEQFQVWLARRQSGDLDQFALTGELVCVLIDPPGEHLLGGKYGDVLYAIPARRGWEFRRTRRDQGRWWIALSATSRHTKPLARQGQITRLAKDSGLSQEEAEWYFDQGSKYRAELAPLWAEILRRNMVQEIASCGSMAELQVRVLHRIGPERLGVLQAYARAWLEKHQEVV